MKTTISLAFHGLIRVVAVAALVSVEGIATRAVTAPTPIKMPDGADYMFARLKDGNLIGVSQSNTNSSSGVIERTIVARMSKDNGSTWSDSESLFALQGDHTSWGFGEVLVDREGELHLFFVIPHSGNAPVSGEGERPLVGVLTSSRIDIGYARSFNNRTRWSKPKVLWIGYTGALNSVVQLESGRIHLPFSYLTTRNWSNRGDGLAAFTFMGQYNSTLIYSDDGGESWSLGTDLMVPTPDIVSAYGAVEPVVVQRADGEVWNLIRTQTGRFWESLSKDGANWSEPRPTDIISSDSPAGLVRLSDGQIVLLWNNCQRYPYAYGGRQVLHAAISDDAGKSWRGFREVGRDPLRNEAPPHGHDYGTAYPFPTLANDEKVLYVSGQGSGRIMRMILDPQWLLEIRQSADFSERAEEWSTFGTRGVGVTQHPNDAKRKVLRISRPEKQWPAAAVWNFPAGRTGKLRLRLMVKGGFRGARITLTDHFSTPFDFEDHFHSVYNLRIGANGRLPNGESLQPNQWYTLELDWNTTKQSCSVNLDGTPIHNLPVVRSSPNVCYLRVVSDTDAADPAGLLIESADVEVGTTVE